jgi:hypothetical protein
VFIICWLSRTAECRIASTLASHIKGQTTAEEFGASAFATHQLVDSVFEPVLEVCLQLADGTVLVRDTHRLARHDQHMHVHAVERLVGVMLLVGLSVRTESGPDVLGDAYLQHTVCLLEPWHDDVEDVVQSTQLIERYGLSGGGLRVVYGDGRHPQERL